MALAIVLTSMGAAGPATAADNGAVPATVTVSGGACLQVSGSYDYGTMAFTQSTVSAGASATGATLVNCDGSSAATILARGTAAVSSTASAVKWELGSPWILGCPDTGTNIYGHSVFDSVSVSGFALSTIDAALTTPLDANGTYDVFGNLAMPCRGSDGAGHVMTFSVIFTATQS
jgi:hypothetical protein